MSRSRERDHQAGVHLSWDGDISRMGHLADRVADLAEVPSRASKAIADDLSGLIQDEFDAGTDPYGTPWKPLAEATLDKGRTPPPLTDTRAMRKSAVVRPMRPAGVAMTIDHPGAPHQTGWSGPQGSGPARPILPERRELPPEWQDVIADRVEAEFKRAGAR
jgi:hypothetical protein